MILLDLMQTLQLAISGVTASSITVSGVTEMASLTQWAQHSIPTFPLDWTLLAQQFDTDVFAGARTFFQNFMESGQVWALLIGIVIGYVMRSLTSYG